MHAGARSAAPFNHITGFSKMLLNTVSDTALKDFNKEDLGTVYRNGMDALIEKEHGQIRQAEEPDEGTIIRFAFPKK